MIHNLLYNKLYFDLIKYDFKINNLFKIFINFTLFSYIIANKILIIFKNKFNINEIMNL